MILARLTTKDHQGAQSYWANASRTAGNRRAEAAQRIPPFFPAGRASCVASRPVDWHPPSADAQRSGMLFSMKENKTPNPVQVGIFRTQAVMQRPNACPDLLQQPGRLRC